MVATQSLHDAPDVEQLSAPCRHTPTGRHSMRSVGTVPGRGQARLDCGNPLLRVCRRRGCEYQQLFTCKSSRSSVCPPCAGRYRRRVRAVALSGLGRAGFIEYFLTLTPPGDREHCKKPGCDMAPYCQHEQCTCTAPAGVDLARWNAEHGARFNHFRTRLRRELAPGMEYMRGCEVQDGKRLAGADAGRMGLHDHLLIRSTVPLDLREVRALAIAAGFGHEVKLVPVTPGSKREGYYVSKYITKSADARREVPWVADVVDLETGELFEGVSVPGRYRTWSCSRQWGMTMVDVKRAAYELRIVIGQALDDESAKAALAALSVSMGAELLKPDGTDPLIS